MYLGARAKIFALTTNYTHKRQSFMFDFENLEVYKKSKEANKEILRFLKNNKQIDRYLKDQLRRASISIVINIAEGSGRFSKADKRNFYIIVRGSVYECVSLLEIILEEKQLTEEIFKNLYHKYEVISKMLLGLINSQKV
ncbi:MAG: four helix bundle protein [bacterium]